MRRVLPLLLLFAALPVSAGTKPENWVQVTSPHFVVVTNANEKQGRRVADQFEKMRALFHSLFPKAEMENGSPIIVLAIRDEKDFRALEPQAYLAKGSLRLGGLFLRGADKNYVLMRMDAEGEHPYSIVYHEYTHFLMSKQEFMPLWLNEGLAEFYQNTDIHEKEVALGQPSGDDLQWLRQNRLLPLTTLFAVDHNSPYYHEENKGSIFYAESWALTHYLEVADFKQKTSHITDYLILTSKQVDPVVAASQSFGDLKKLQDALEGYVRRTDSFTYFKVPTPSEIDDSVFKVQPMSGVQSDAVRADFLAYNDRATDAQTLLDHVLQQDPNNVSAHETKGYIEFRQGHLEEAKKWYAKAVELDSRSYLAHYYFAAMSMQGGGSSSDEQVESALRTSVKLNPSFAPAFDLLGVFLASRGKDVDEAHIMGLTAVSLEPANVRYRINVANVLMRMNQSNNALAVLRYAAKLAKTPEESQMVESFLAHAQEFAEAQERQAEWQRQAGKNAQTDEEGENDNVTEADTAKPDTFVAAGPHHSLVGVLKGVRCQSAALDLTVTSKVMTVKLHAENYYHVEYTTLNIAPTGNLNPCKDLEGRPAKVEYVESADKSVTPRVLAIELHK